MGKSLDFCKQRVKSQGFEVKDNAHWTEVSFLDNCGVTERYQREIKNNGLFVRYTPKQESGRIAPKSLSIMYDRNADFEYFTHIRERCDGTLYFFVDQCKTITERLLGFCTYNRHKLTEEMLNEINNYDIVYTVGNYVLIDEYGEEFAPEDKKWMKSRFTTLLPIKFDVTKM